MANVLNDDLECLCSDSPSIRTADDARVFQRLYAFGVLPLVPFVSLSSVFDTIEKIASLPHLKGIIMGTRGIGKGLDDDALEPVWSSLAEKKLVVFIHPHYGVEAAWGEKDNGHVLPLALGFPFETTTVCCFSFQNMLLLFTSSGYHTADSFGCLRSSS